MLDGRKGYINIWVREWKQWASEYLPCRDSLFWALRELNERMSETKLHFFQLLSHLHLFCRLLDSCKIPHFYLPSSSTDRVRLTNRASLLGSAFCSCEWCFLCFSCVSYYFILFLLGITGNIFPLSASSLWSLVLVATKQSVSTHTHTFISGMMTSHCSLQFLSLIHPSYLCTSGSCFQFTFATTSKSDCSQFVESEMSWLFCCDV